MKRRLLRSLFGITLFVGGADFSEALPHFSRVHARPCSACHTVYPKLTPFGRAFKENGFRVDGEEGSWKETLRSFPASLRAAAVKEDTIEESPADRVSLKAVSTGSLGSRVSYWADWSFVVTEPDSENDLDTRFDEYWVRFDDLLRGLRPGLLNFKAGQFELDLPFSQARTYNLFPYMPYGLGFFDLAAPETGVELSGAPGKGIRYVVAIDAFQDKSLKQDGALEVRDYDRGLYSRVSKTFSSGDRIGMFFSRNRQVIGVADPPELLFRGLGFELRATRLGADADWWSGSRRLNIYGLYLWGRDRLGRSRSSDEFHSALVQLDTRLSAWATLVGRYEFARDDPFDFVERRVIERTRNRFTVGVQLWAWERLKFGAEYQLRDEDTLVHVAVFGVDLVL